MEPTPATITPEAHKLPEDMSFADVDAIEVLRAKQDIDLYTAGRQAISGLTAIEALTGGAKIRNEARQKVIDGFEERCKIHLDDHMKRDDNPEAYDQILFMLRATSVDKMDSEKWYLGEKDADGKHTKPETSGQTMVKATLDQLRADYPAGEPTEPDLPFVPNTPEFAEAMGQLAESRNKLAALSLKRRQMIRKKGKKADQLESDYVAASIDYNSRVKFIQAGLINYWREGGKSQADILGNGVHVLLDEHMLFSQAEMIELERNNTRRYKVAKWIASHNVLGTGANIVASAAIGYGLKAAIKGTAGVALGLAAPMAAAGLVAGRTAKAMLSATIGNQVDQIRHFDKRYNEDHAELTRQASGITYDANASDLEKAGKHVDLLKEVIDRRIATDVKLNRRRVRNAIIFSGAAAVAGEFIQEMVSTGAHPWGIGTQHPGGTPQAEVPGNGGVQPPENPGGQPPAPGPGTGDGTPPPHEPWPHGHSGPAHHDHPHNADVGGGDHGDTDGTNGHPAQPNDGGGSDESAPKPQHDAIDTKHTTVTVENGNGYYQEIQDIFNQNGQHLTGAGVRDLYSELADKFHGNFFTNDASYKMSDGFFGIGHPGSAHWNAAVIHYMNEWAEKHADELTKIGKAGKVAGKAAKAALAGAGK